MLQVRNRTPLTVGLMLAPDAQGVDHVWATIKGTFTLAPTPQLCDEQLPVAREPVHLEDPATSSQRVPIEVGLAKPGTDVLIDGAAIAPGGRPATWMDVAAVVGPVQQRARVFGDRWWIRQGSSYVRTDPAPFERVPLTWERAFGGRSTVLDGERHESRNPIGSGYRHPDAIDWPEQLPAANIEDPEAPLTALGTSGTPVGFLPIAPHWQPRPRYAGTYDDAWQRERAPYLPHDFDARFLHVAPPALTATTPFAGGEGIQLWGMTESGYAESRVPAVALEVAFAFGREVIPRPVAIDTIRIEPEHGRFTVCWHAFVDCDKRALKMTELRVSATELP